MESVQSIVIKRIIKLGKRFVGEHHTAKELVIIQKKSKRRVPFFINQRFKVSKIFIENTPVFYISDEKDKKAKNDILYLHGGAYVNQITIFHWLFISKLITETHSRVIVPLYPLAPTSNYKDVVRIMLALYNKIISESDIKNLTIMGDSAGGGLALALTEAAYEQKLPLAKNLIMISPWLDITLQNPEIKSVLKNDLMLDMKLVDDGLMYAGGDNRLDYRLSPLYGKIDLPINMTLLIGTHDILYPDCKKFNEIAINSGVNINYIEQKNMVHCWPLLPIPEARSAFLKIKRVICEASDTKRKMTKIK